MSMEWCAKHDRYYDTDKVSTCYDCDEAWEYKRDKYYDEEDQWNLKHSQKSQD